MIVGQVEQAAHQNLVAFERFGSEPVARGGRLLDHEPALRSDRDDDRVLDRLRLHQPEDLGAEILLAVRPADAAARHLAGAHVHAFHARAVDVDFEQRSRQRQQFDLAAGELDREVRLRLARRQLLKIICPHRLEDEGQIAAQDAVFVEAGDCVELVVDRLDLGHRRERRVRSTRGIKARSRTVAPSGRPSPDERRAYPPYRLG